MCNRDILVNMGFEDSIVFENPDFDDAIIGVDLNDDRVVYDYEKMVEVLAEQDGISIEESADFIGYNTLRAIPYMGPKAPIVIRKLEDF